MTGLSETAIRGASRTMVRRQERDDRAGAGLTVLQAYWSRGSPGLPRSGFSA
jgi:hypothetical protein